MSRIAPALDDLIGIEDPDDLMVEIMDLLSESGTPQVGNYYTFVYRPKTSSNKIRSKPSGCSNKCILMGFQRGQFSLG